MVYVSPYTPEEQKARRAATRRRYYLRNKERHHADSKRWRANNSDKYAAALKKHDLKRHYGMTPEEWDNLFTKQGSKCAVCPRTEPTKIGWCVDHDHKSKRVRGIVCSPCNTALGLVKDNPATLRSLADYLERGLTWDRSS